MGIQDYYYEELIEYIKKKRPSKDELAKHKIKLCSKYKVKKIPTDIEIYMKTPKKDLAAVKKYVITKPTRTISGVSIVAIMTRPEKCPHGKCIFCPGGVDSFFGDVPQSYTGREPATMRALRAQFDPYIQVMNRLEQYVVLGQLPEKIELIIMGGTFPAMSPSYQDTFIRYAFKALNDFSRLFFKEEKFDLDTFKTFFELPGTVGSPERTKSIHKKLMDLKGKTTLEKEQKKNETSHVKCVGLTIETRPDYGKKKEGNQMLKLGCTRVELGVQTTQEEFLKSSKRGHSLNDSIESIKILKDLGFKLNFHFMLGLPGSTPENDLEMLKELFTNQDFQPDMLKIYPCMVMPGTELHQMYLAKKYTPISTSESIEVISEFKRYVPEYCRIMRVQRDIPTKVTHAGVDRINLRQYISDELKEKKIKCRCIRCREAGRAKNIGKTELMIKEYSASDGKEYFIAIEDKKNDVLIGFCRLRFPSTSQRKEIPKDSALIRELHVYGTQHTLIKGKTKKSTMQHKGHGKKLLKKAEQIAKKQNKKKMVIISGVGVREYYRNLGYRKEGPYMVKKI